MVRIGISVEGTTEERFVKQVLEPYLAERGVYVTAISMNGEEEFDGRPEAINDSPLTAPPNAWNSTRTTVKQHMAPISQRA